MSANHPIVYTTSSPRKQNDIARFGYTEPGRNNRIAIYTTEILHPLEAANDNTNNETMFYLNRLNEVQAWPGEVEPVTLAIVEGIADFCNAPFDDRVGIRISASDKPDYVSKIVIRLKRSVSIDFVLSEIAANIYGRANGIRSSFVYDEQPSRKEVKDRILYDMFDN